MHSKKRIINHAVNFVFGLYLIGYCILGYHEFMSDKPDDVAMTVGVVLYGATATLLLVLFKNFKLVFIFAAFKIASKHVMKDKQSKADFGKHKDYYRDINKQYSPAVMSFIDDFQLGYKDVVATLLYLLNRKYIEIVDSQIKMINNDFSVLHPTGLYLMQNLDNCNMDKFRETAINAAKEHGLIEQRLFTKEAIKKRIVIGVALTAVAIGLFVALIKFNVPIIAFFNKYNSQEPFTVFSGFISFFCMMGIIITFVAPFIFPVCYIIYLILYAFLSAKKPYHRTAKGNELNHQLEGLKNYLKEFSVLHKKDAAEVELWDDYLIYSVMFGHNKNIIDEFSKYGFTISL